MDPHVEALFTAPEDSAPMVRYDRVECVEGGIEGDRYLLGTGYYSPFDVCEVTFVAAEAVDEIREAFDLDLTDGRHRRNVVLRGVGTDELHDLLGAKFRIGGATFRGTRPRPPCAHVEQVAGEKGVARALKERRGGICVDVLDAGPLSVGDELDLLEPDARGMGERIVDRLRGDGGE
ncbi:MOSC domain-containing protein [Halorarum halobium]|uniref:MOSC domain-containing protein n=1 Tax=Halorarum halobium TaxID=3075121 RepID=UPI0028B1A93D|nr:MOSC domain-containing protein [Halobaculum sp. XH14]